MQFLGSVLSSAFRVAPASRRLSRPALAINRLKRVRQSAATSDSAGCRFRFSITEFNVLEFPLASRS